jgi:hypothetical protein
MFWQFLKTYTLRLTALVAAGVTAAMFGILGYYQTWGAYLIGWAPYLTPQVARWLFWTAAAVLAVFFVVIPIINGFSRKELWAEREELELSAIANLSVGKGIDEKYDQEPQLSRHRLLKDAVRKEQLQVIDMAGDKPNVHTLVSRESLRTYATASNNPGLVALVARWDRMKPRKPAPLMKPSMDPPIASRSATGPDEFFTPAVTQYVPADIPARLFMKGWWLDFNPNSPRGKKELVFNIDGTFGEGGNKNEFRWQMKNGLLEIYRESKLLQNRFRYDPASGKFTCTNDPDAEGYKDQTIYRPKND